MEQLLKKIEKIRKKKLDELSSRLQEIQEKELKPQTMELDSLQEELEQKKIQLASMAESRKKLDQKKAVLESESRIKEELFNDFVAEYFEKLKKDDEKYKKAMSEYINAIKSEKGKLTIDERTYNIFKAELGDDLHIVTNNQINGFKFESDKVEIISTLKEMKDEVMSTRKIELMNILFS